MKNILIYLQVCRRANRLAMVMQRLTHYGTTFPANRLTSSHVSYLNSGILNNLPWEQKGRPRTVVACRYQSV